MSHFHEQYGRLAEENLDLVDAYGRTLELLKNLKEGVILLSQVSVREDGWDVAPAQEEPLTYEEAKARTLAGVE